MIVTNDVSIFSSEAKAEGEAIIEEVKAGVNEALEEEASIIMSTGVTEPCFKPVPQNDLAERVETGSATILDEWLAHSTTSDMEFFQHEFNEPVRLPHVPCMCLTYMFCTTCMCLT